MKNSTEQTKSSHLKVEAKARRDHDGGALYSGTQVEIRGHANSEGFIFHVINPKSTDCALLYIIRACFMLHGHLIFIGMNSSEKYKGF